MSETVGSFRKNTCLCEHPWRCYRRCAPVSRPRTPIDHMYSFAVRPPPSCAQQRVAPACRAVAVSRRRIALAKADSIRDSRADYTPPTTPCLAKISVPDRRRRSASSPATIPDCCGRTRPTCPNSEIGAGAPLPCRDIVTAKRFRCRRLARFRIATTNRR